MDLAAPSAFDDPRSSSGSTRSATGRGGAHLSVVRNGPGDTEAAAIVDAVGAPPVDRAVAETRAALRRLRGDALTEHLARYRPEGERYAGHVLGLDLAGPGRLAVERGLARTLRTYRLGRRQRRRPSSFVERLHVAVRTEAWRLQRRRRRRS